MSSTNNKYVAPNKRPQSTGTTRTSTRAQQSESLDVNLFPTLKETLTTSRVTQSFASVTKKVDPIILVVPIISDVKPGWVHIRQHKGQIQFKSNPTNKLTYSIEDEIYEDKRLSKYLFKRRTTLQQEYRDIQTELLGDLSPYWNTKTIAEMHEDDEYQEGDFEEDYTSGHSDLSD